MGTYQNYADTPNGIAIEGQEITISFTNNGDGTGTITWNIPVPANGCSSDTQSYDGILITIDTKRANYITTSPKNGVRYNADATADPDLNVADNLDGALIVGAFYNDKTTTSLTVTDVNPDSFYFVSGYAVDNVGVYYREGVHAYSLATGSEEKQEVLYNAYQDISIISKDGSKVMPSTLTGLDPSQEYTLHIQIDRKDFYITVKGSESQSYADLINSLNIEFKKITGTAGFGSCGELPTPVYSYKSPFPPKANTYYVDLANKKVYLFDGYKNNLKPSLFFDQDPYLKPQGVYWYNPNEPDTIKMYETGGWATQPYIESATDPTKPDCGELWFTGSEVYEWDGDYWAKLCLYIQTRNPQIAPVMDCSTYWYNTTDSTLEKWNADSQEFEEALALISSKDPNDLGVGDFWYNETDSKMYRFSAGTWNSMTTVRYDEPNSDGDISYIAPNTYWLNPVNQTFFKRNAENTAWTEVNYVMYPTDPMDRSSGDLWWNQSPSVDTLYVWDTLHNKWIAVTNFIQQATDPSLPAALPSCAVWYNPTTGDLKYIFRNSCSSKNFIESSFDPMDPPVGTVWYDTTNAEYYTWDGSEWVEIYPIISTTDPYELYVGYLWYDTVNNKLYSWNGTGWTNETYVTSSPLPSTGDLWYDTITNELYVWTGTQWSIQQPIVEVSMRHQDELHHNPEVNGRAYLFFLFTIGGCCHIITIIPEAKGLFSEIQQSVIYHDPMEGGNSAASGPMSTQLGVGTDGSPDERRELHSIIRSILGMNGVTVELSKQNLNTCIDNALKIFRMKSSYAYTRNFFFLNLKPNQQTYTLANKCVGFNKITNVRVIYRMQAGWIRTGLAGNELFGVSALQQLYTVGTFDMLSFASMSMYMKEMEQLFASRIMHEWVESTRELRLFQRIVLPEHVLVDASVERTEQDLMTNRFSGIWIQKWATAEAKQILGQVRSKYTSLPGPTGSTSLNGQDLLAQSETEKQALLDQLDDPEMGNLVEVGLAAHFVIG